MLLNSVWPFLQQLLLLLHLVLMATFAYRVIMQRLPVGVSLAWLLVLALLPYVGIILYWLFGERHLGVKHTRRRHRLNQQQHIPTLPNKRIYLDWRGFHPASSPLSLLETGSARIPVVGGNSLHFLTSAEQTLLRFCSAIDEAKSHCHVEFYIWHNGGHADLVAEALMRARARGVICRVMLDAVGSASFLRSLMAKRLVAAGVELIKACPIGFIPNPLARYDLRNHRKNLIIDAELAFVGSSNLVDPKFFKQEQGVGQWIDLMAEVKGPVVSVLEAVFLWYWNIETGQQLPMLPEAIEFRYDASMIQIAPSGPDQAGLGILQSLLQGIYSAHTSVDLVTPYFVPGEALEQALIIAARRGVQVRLVVPKKVDSFLVRHASRSYFLELMEAGVEIYQFEDGLLHTKCVIIDQAISFFGTVNLDSRSLWLNFEQTLIIYDQATTQKLVDIVDSYRLLAPKIAIEQWQKRSRISRFFENITHLISPLI